MTTSLLFLVLALLSLLFHQAASASPGQSGYFGKLESVLLGTPSESLRLAARDDGEGEPAQPAPDLPDWLLLSCIDLLLSQPPATLPAAVPAVPVPQTAYNLLAPPLRAPPAA